MTITFTIPVSFAGRSGNQDPALLDQDFQALVTALSGVALNASDLILPRTDAAGGLVTYISGTSISVGPGAFRDDADSADLKLLATTTMSNLTVGWVVGTNQPKIRTGVTLANGMTLHLYIIKRTDTGVVDWFLTDETPPTVTLPAGYTKSRRWKSFKFGASTQTFQAFYHDVLRDYIGYLATTVDQNVNTPAAAGTLRTMNVPTGINVVVEFNTWCYSSTIGVNTLFSDPARNDEAPAIVAGTAPGANLNNSPATLVDVQVGITLRSNLIGQVRSHLSATDANTNLEMFTTGYYDFGGRNS